MKNTTCIFYQCKYETPKLSMMLRPKQGREYFRNYVKTEHDDTMYDDIDGDIYYSNHK